jgi:hypothetical protein
MLVAVVDTSTWRVSPAVGNASVDAAATIFFFTTDGKTHIRVSLFFT